MGAGRVRVHRRVQRWARRRGARLRGGDRGGARDRRRWSALLDGVRSRPVHGARRATGRSARPVRGRACGPVTCRALPALGDLVIGVVPRDARRSRSCRWAGRGIDRLRPCGGRPHDVGDGAVGPHPPRVAAGTARGGTGEQRPSSRIVVLDLGPLNWAWVMHGIAAVRHRGGRHAAQCDRCVRGGVVSSCAQAHPELQALHHATKAEAFTRWVTCSRAAGGDRRRARRDGCGRGSVRPSTSPRHARRRRPTGSGMRDDAEAHAHEALRLSRSMVHKRGVVDALEVLGGCAQPIERATPRRRGSSGPRPLCGKRRGTRTARPSPSRRSPRPAPQLESALGADEGERAWRRGCGALLRRGVRLRREGSGRAQAAGDRVGGAHRDRGEGRRSRRRRADERPGRRAAVHLPSHRRQPSSPHLRQARRLDPGRARHAGRSPGWRRRVMFPTGVSPIMSA